MKFIYATLFLFLSLNVKAGLINNDGITATASSIHNNSIETYGTRRALDNDLNTAWATIMEGPGAWIKFDFGVTTLISEVWYTDRVAARDNAIRYNLEFTVNNITQIQEVFSPDYNNTDITSINNGEGFWTRYLTFRVIEAGEFIPNPEPYSPDGYVIGQLANVGGREFSFYDAPTTETVPEPSTLAIFALGMIGLASRRMKKQS